MHLKQIVFVVILQAFTYGLVQSQTTGKHCTTDSGKKGSCILVDNCASAIKLLRAGSKPKTCGFEGKTPKVCCENPTEVREKVAEKKCLEYGKKFGKARSARSTSKSGRSKRAENAIGGTNASPLEFPHMAILGYGNAKETKWLCGGSLISENFVLTAAHCLTSKYGNVKYIKLGVHRLSYITRFIQKFEVKKVHQHSNYSATKQYHDVALIELDRAANLQVVVKPACLHTSKQLPTESFTATGWGATELYGNINDILQKVNLSYVSYDKCTGYYNKQGKLPDGLVDDWQICADGGGARADTCQGDSGGPLQLPLNPNTKMYTIIGITSFGIKCAIVPAVYTRVSHYVPWIESIVWPKG